MSGAMILGPLDEKETVVGAMTSFLALLGRIVAIGFLMIKQYAHPHCNCFIF